MEEHEKQEQLAQRKSDNQKMLMNNHISISCLRSDSHRLDKLWVKPWTSGYKENKKVGKPKTPLLTSRGYVESLRSSDIKWPIFHIYGQGGTGKSHFAKGLCRWLILNMYPYGGAKSFVPFQYVDWPAYIDSKLSNGPLRVNWEARLMLIEDIDRQPPISQKGSTHSLSYFLNNVKPRIENGRLPTIIVTRRSPKGLANFLATDFTGKTVGEARGLAGDVASLIGNTIHSGMTYGESFTKRMMNNPDYYKYAVLPELEKQKKKGMMKELFGGGDYTW